MNLIEEYVSILSKITDTPDLFLKAAGYYLISTLCGRNVYSKWTPKREGISSNEWFLISGKPAITRRSTVIDHTLDVFRNVYTRVLQQVGNIIIEADSYTTELQVAQSIAKATVIERATPEGLSDHIGETVEQCKIYTLATGEWGTIIQQIRAKDYMSGYLGLLSKMYYGEGDIMYKAKSHSGAVQKREIPKGLYVTAFFGMQDPTMYLDSSFIEQGLLRRIILIHIKPEEKGKFLNPLDQRREDAFDDLKKFEDKIYPHALEYNSIGDIYTDIPFPIISKINEYSKQLEDQYIKDQSSFNLYKQNFWEHLLKLTIINAIASRNPYKNYENKVEVKWSDYQNAYSFLSEVLQRAESTISSIATTYRERDYVTAQGILEQIESLIAEAGEKGVIVSLLLNKTYMFDSDLKGIILTLLKQEKIIVTQTSEITPQFCFYLKKFENNIKSQILSSDYVSSMW